MASRYTLMATRPAAKVIDGLEKDVRRQWDRLRGELRSQGCKAAGYRLLAIDGGLSPFCCTHLVRDWRVVTEHDDGVVLVMAVGRHDGDRFYRDLAEKLGTSEVGQRREQKPACC